MIFYEQLNFLIDENQWNRNHTSFISHTANFSSAILQLAHRYNIKIALYWVNKWTFQKFVISSREISRLYMTEVLKLMWEYSSTRGCTCFHLNSSKKFSIKIFVRYFQYFKLLQENVTAEISPIYRREQLIFFRIQDTPKCKMHSGFNKAEKNK